MHDDRSNNYKDDGASAPGSKESDNIGCGRTILLENISSTQGMLLAVYVSNIMSEGLNASQINILGNFVTTVGDLMLYKAARDVLDQQEKS